MVNKVILLGNLGKDLETRFTPNGKAVTRFSLATSNTWVGANGEKQQATEWHTVVVWGKQGEACGQYLEKGVKFTSRERFATDPTTTKTARNSTSPRSLLRKFDSSAAQTERAKENNLRKSIQMGTKFRFRCKP